MDLPAVVDTDIFVTPATTAFGEIADAIKKARPSYVVIRRDFQGDTLNYAFPSEDVLRIGSGRGRQNSLLNALNLHETDHSNSISLAGVAKPLVVTGESATARRGVVLVSDQPVGVVGRMEPASGSALAGLARMVAAPKTEEEAIRARRIMPSLLPPVMDVSKLSPPVEYHIPKRGGSKFGAARVTVSAITCHFRAEMDQEVLVKRPARVDVLVSRELIDQVIDSTAAEGRAKIDPKRKIFIQVLPKVNFESVDKGWTEIDSPQPGAPQPLSFMVKATHVGEGEIWVVVRQGQVPLVTLILKPVIVKAEGETVRRAVATATTPEASKLAAPLHQLFITEQHNGNQLTYLFQLQAPDLKLLEWGTSRPILGDRMKYVTKLYEEIEKRWVSNQEDVENFTEELRAIGANMFDELLPANVQAGLWEYRDRIKSIMVIAEEPFIPWELVHISKPGKPLSEEMLFMGQMGLVRWLHEVGWPPEQLRIQKGKARYVIPHYPHPDYQLPQAEQEAVFLEQKFAAMAVEPRSSVVRKLLSKPGEFNLLHFACHGAAEQDNIANAQLLMEGRAEAENYIPDPLTATTVEHYANLSEGGNPPIIVLNACQVGRAGYKLTGIGGFAQAFLRRGAGAFVGTLWSVGDVPARNFTEKFYSRLLKGATIADATIVAREEARKAGDATWLAYVVYGHPHAKVKKK